MASEQVGEILRTVWGNRKGFVFLPQRTNYWRETSPIAWPTSDPLDPLINEEADQYFCPVVFSEKNRRKEYATPTSWLWADLDTVDPRKLDLQPSIAWQTSPGRYQGLWSLARPLAPDKLEDLNRRLTYATGADKGGWHLTKVLRVPLTFNYKYDRPKRGRVLWVRGTTYKLSEIREFVKGVEAHDIATDVRGLVLPVESRDSILSRTPLDARTLALLNETDEQPEGDRSERLWELECRLLEAGLSPEETFVVVRETVWNKFAGRTRGDIQLWSEVRKAHLHVGSSVEVLSQNDTSLLRMRPRIISYGDLLGSRLSEPEWLVEDWWTLGSHGIIAGLPKSYKSLVTLDLAVSVASETPFLGLSDVNPKGVGPVLVIQQENSLPLLRDRLWKIGHSRGLNSGSAFLGDNGHELILQLPPAIPLMFYNDFAFNMAVENDREAVEDIIQKEGVKLVIFDPLYLMIGGADENNAKEMRPILSWLLRLRNLYSCAVVVVHHWGKQTQGRGGRGTGGIRLLGSTTIYGWLEAALYLEADHTTDRIEVVVEREFRERLSPPPISFGLNMGDIGEDKYEWTHEGPAGSTNRLIWAIEQAGEKGATYDTLRSELDIGLKKLRSQLRAAMDKGIVSVSEEDRVKRFYIAGS